MSYFDNKHIVSSFGGLILHLSSKLRLGRDLSYNLAGNLKLIVKHVSGMQNEPFDNYLETSLNRIELCYCCKCTTSIEINDESIISALEMIQEDELLSKVTLCFVGNEKCRMGITYDCNHESEIILYIENSITFLIDLKNTKKQILIKDFGNFGSPNISPSNYKVKDYLSVLKNLSNLIETDGYNGPWRLKKKWLLRFEPEKILQTDMYSFLIDKFNDGRIEKDLGLAGGSLDFLIHGDSLPKKSILIEVKWVGKSDTKKADDSIYESGKKSIIFGISQVIKYKKGYELQAYKKGAPYVFVIDAQEKRKAFNELNWKKTEVPILWARLDALSPSKKAKLK